MSRTCSNCKVSKKKECFSKNQWSKTPITSSCIDCCNGVSPLASSFNGKDWNEYNPNIEELKNYPKGIKFFEMIDCNNAMMSLHLNNSAALIKKLQSQPPNQTEAAIQKLYQVVVNQFKVLNEQLDFATNANQTIIDNVMTSLANKNTDSVPNFEGIPFALAINAMLVLANMWRDYMDAITNVCFRLHNFNAI